ncbi:MAG: PAS domain S-box protein [Ignavibacteriales bacterium]|nr:PAS domain S-box protein [Ignavibacteriales bacterium]
MMTIEYIGLVRILLLVVAAGVFFFLIRRLTKTSLSGLGLIGIGISLVLLNMIVGAVFHSLLLSSYFDRNFFDAVGIITGYIGQTLGLILLLVGMYRLTKALVAVKERERAEENKKIIAEAIRENEERYHRFFEEDFSGNFISTPGGKIMTCNSVFAKIFGYDSVEEALATNAYAYYLTKEDREKYLHLIRKHRRLKNYRQLMQRKNGSLVYVVANLIGEFDDRDELVQIKGYVVDDTEQRESEDKLEKSLSLLRATLESTADGILVVDKVGAIVSFNQKFVDMWRIPPSVVEKHNDKEAIAFVLDQLKEPETFQRKIEELYNQPDSESLDVLEFKDGRVFERYSKPQRIGGTIAGRVWSFRDVTERKRAEQAVQESEERYRAFIINSTEGIWRIELDQPLPLSLPEDEQVKHIYAYSYIAESNDAMARMYGYSRAEEFVGIRLTDLHDVSDPNNYEHLRSVICAGYRLSDTLTHEIDKNGQTRYFLNNVVGIVKDGFVVRFWGSQRDVTEQRRKDALLKESEEKYRQLFEDSKDVAFISTPEGNFLEINQAGIELFGYASKEELMNVNIGRDLYVDPVDREKAGQFLVQQGYLKDYEILVKSKNGKRLIIKETSTPVRNQRGEIIAYRGIIRDVTEQKLLEEQLRRAQKMESIGTLAGGIAHDFNNILTIILAYASNLADQTINSEKYTHNLSAIQKAVERGAGMVRQLLTFARKASGVFKPVNVNETVSELSKLLAETFSPNIEFKLQLAEHLPIISADVSQLQQAIMNLCVNARDAIESSAQPLQGGTLTMTTNIVSGEALRGRFHQARKSEYVLISVADTGTGMDEDTRTRIFEPFFTTKELGKGTGLGLAVVYGVVNSHHGFIDVETKQDGGTTMHLYFPVHQTGFVTYESSQKQDSNKKPDKGLMVLLVEDEEMLLELLQTLLEENGYEVLVARDGQEAVDIYTRYKDKISVVLSDMGLPKLGGWEAFQKMKEINPKVKSILASGYLDPNLRADMIKAGAKDFVQKPYIPEIILARIREVINGA